MVLHRLYLNPANVGVAHDLASPYKMHQTLSRVIGNSDRCLFRIEADTGNRAHVLVQTRGGTDWTPLVDNKYLLAHPESKLFNPEPIQGMTYRFRVVVNPTIKRKHPDKKNSTRIPLVHRGDNQSGHPTYMDWLYRKAKQSGFSVARVIDSPFRIGRRLKSGARYSKYDIPLFGVRFDGVLICEDSSQLATTIRNGLGPAKAFGFGLLSVAQQSRK